MDAAAFDEERTAVYGIGDPETRERAFVALNERWFRRLRIQDCVLTALAEQQDWTPRVCRILVALPPTSQLEGAELFVAGPQERSLVIGIRAETLVETGPALVFLRRELMHVADMVDPDFAYAPSLPSHPAGPAHDRLVLDRYRLLWDCTVDGRLASRGRLGDHERTRRAREFTAAFPSLAPRVEACFACVFDGPRPSHPQLVAMAQDPQAAFGLAAASRTSAHRCPLCSFPTTALEPAPGDLAEDVLDAIRSDFPAWDTSMGLCVQCADLYRASAMSREAAALLPGIR